MSDTTAMTLGIAVGLALVFVLGFGYRRRRRPRLTLVPRPTGEYPGLAPPEPWPDPRPSDSWSDAEVDKLRAALEAPEHPLEERDEHEGAGIG